MSVAICSIECREDRDCGRGKVCIQDGCRRICSPLMSVGVCEEQCREDRDCAAGEKCVGDGCGHVCSPAPQASICESQCFRDRDCGAGRGSGNLTGDELIHGTVPPDQRIRESVCNAAEETGTVGLENDVSGRDAVASALQSAQQRNRDLERVQGCQKERLELVLKGAQEMDPVPRAKNAAAMAVENLAKSL
ncbi:hypothetical protein JEQ12_003351 [Ovis aries]|uniref:WAP domain-containing protein n=1 Tax=Ovis aries TaxID=9940 RepID=A0A835ZZ34_SHEEP|nr:hypothetical protein JEQ12_003351 [Ovis aries]